MKKDPANLMSHRLFSGLVLNSGPSDYEAEVLTSFLKKKLVYLFSTLR